MQTHGKQRPKTNSGRNKFSDAPRGTSNAHASQMHAHPLFRRMYQRGWKLVPLMPIFHVCITYCVTLLSALPKASFYLGTQRCAQSVSMYVSFSGHARMHVYVCVCVAECIDLMRSVTSQFLIHQSSRVLWFWPSHRARLFVIHGTTRQTECGFIVSLEPWCGSVCGVDPVCPFERGD